jgi:hypothetical protein
VENQLLAMPSKPRSHHTFDSSRTSLINDWLTRFAINADKSLDDRARAVYSETWLVGFADLDTDRLRAAFVACLHSHKFKTMPTIGDVRQHLSKAQGSANEEQAAKKWDVVLAYALQRSPDIAEKNPPRISERTGRAIRAAGGLNWIRDCPAKELPWARTRFIESYIRFGELLQSEYLLPDGEAKNLLAGAAQKLLPPSDSYTKDRERGIAYAEELKAQGCTPDIQRAMRAIVQDTKQRPPARSLEEQKSELRKRGLLPA